MAGVKQQMIHFAEQLPDDATWDDVMAQLYFKLKVDSGLKDLDEGKSVSHEQARERMAKWLNKE